MAQYLKPRSRYLGNNDDVFEVVMVADQEGNIINDFGGAAANITLAAGLLEGYSHVHKFGATDGDVTSGSVWDGKDGSVVYPYPAAGVLSITSTLNAGAAVQVEGLDENYNSQVEVVPIGGTGTMTFSRVFRAFMIDTNNDADVEINLNGALVAKILQDLAQTLMSVYTVPAGKTAYLLDLHMGSDKASTNTAMTYRLFARPFGGTFNIKCNFNAAGGQSLDIDYQVPLRFEEKTDLRVDVVAGQATQVSATFDLILVDND